MMAQAAGDLGAVVRRSSEVGGGGKSAGRRRTRVTDREHQQQADARGISREAG